MRRRRWSMRTRLTLIAAAAVTATALLVCALAYLALDRTLLHQADQELDAISQSPVRQIDPDVIASISPNPLHPSSALQFQVQLPDGRVQRPPDVVELPFGPHEQEVAAGRVPSSRYTLNTTQGRFRVLVLPGAQRSTVQFARSLADYDATVDRMGVLMVVRVGGAAVIAALAGRLLARVGLAPMYRLTSAAARIADTQDLAHPIPVIGDDEVARLGQTFNGMLTALGRSRQAQRELIEDAAHELRTPMSSLRTNLELLIHAGQRLTPDDRTALLRDLDRQSLELSELVADLVDLARSAGTDEAPVCLDLAEVVASAIDRARARTPSSHITLDAQPVTVTGRPAGLERAVVNLLDNAVKFGPAEQTVEVTVEAAPDGRAELTVADRAPTIPAEERERIFGRFHRLAASRGVPGSGLGLAIVAQTAASHGGDVLVEPRPHGGNIFRLRLPATARSKHAG